MEVHVNMFKNRVTVNFQEFCDISLYLCKMFRSIETLLSFVHQTYRLYEDEL